MEELIPLELVGFPFIVSSLISEWLRNGEAYDHCTSQGGCRPWVYFARDEILLVLLPLHNHHDLNREWSKEICRNLQALDSFYQGLIPTEFLEMLIDSMADTVVTNVIRDLKKFEEREGIGSGYPDPLDWYGGDFPCRAEFTFPWHYATAA